MKQLQNYILIIGLVLFSAMIMFLSVRGLSGNPTGTELNSSTWKENGPFELSPERGRFALTYSIVETKSFQFSDSIGKFAIPDVGVSKGKYVSLFAPLLSFIAIPGYIVGKFFGMSQVGAFATIALFALFNLILIRLIAIRLGARPLPATIASLVFLFGTPAFAYAVNLYQHHISTFLILLSIYALLKSKKSWSFTVVFFLCALAIPLDYPNLFFMFPIGLFALGRVLNIDKVKNKVSIKVNVKKMLTVLIMTVPIIFFLWFNYISYGNPFQLSGTLPTAKHILDKNISNSNKQNTVTQLQALSATKINKSAISFFQTRDLLNGFYIHFISPDRGVIYYAPVVLFGALGFVLALKKRVKMTALLISILGANVLLYSMWGDPWGGWAFGSRYLIPSYAILSIFIALLLTYWGKKLLLLVIFLPIAIYSIAVNTLGAITTSAIPPQAEVLNLEKISGVIQRYTYQRNWEFLLAGNSKSFVYQTFLKNHLTTLQFYLLLMFSICVLVSGILIYNFWSVRNGEKNV